MKRTHKFLHTLPMKFYLLLGAVMLFAFFSNDFGLVDIQKTAVILAAGVDKKEDESYTLTAQIAVPKGADRTTGGTSSVNVIGEGNTVSECIAKIYNKTGWVPKLVFCDLIIIGEQTLKNGAACSLDFFLRNEYISDSCLICTCEGTAQELLTSTSAIDDTSSLAIGKLFSDAAKKSGRTESNTLREFTISNFNQSKSGYLPYVRMKEQEDSGDSSAAQDQSAASTGGGESEQEKKMIYTAAETALVLNTEMVGLLSADETNLFSLLRGEVLTGTLTADDNGTPASLTVLKDDGSVSLNMKGAPTVKLSLDLKVRLYNYCDEAPIEKISDNTPSQALMDNLKKKLEASTLSLWEKVAGSGCDLFEIKRDLYRSSKKKYEEWEQTLLTVVKPEIEIKISAVK